MSEMGEEVGDGGDKEEGGKVSRNGRQPGSSLQCLVTISRGAKMGYGTGEDCVTKGRP